MEIIMPEDELAWIRGINRKLEHDMRHQEIECYLAGLFAILMVIYIIMRIIGDV